MTGTLLDELKSWRDQAITAGTVKAGVIKDAYLSQIVRSNRRTEDEIARMLPPTARPMAASIVAVLGGGEAAAASEPQEPVAEVASAAKPVKAPGRAKRSGATLAAAAPAAPLAGLLELGQEDFCEYDYGMSEYAPTEVRIRASKDTQTYSWEAFEVSAGEVAVYRVITNENSAAYKPEAGTLIAATEGTTAVDSAPVVSAVRHVQVWCHVGSDVRDATANQPIVIAQGHLISGVTDFVITEEEGAVIGQWSAWPGVSAVRVSRIPLDGPRGTDAQHQIAIGHPNLTGFVDRDAERGRPYLYRAVCEVVVDGVTRLSKPEQDEVVLSVVLEPVADLRVSAHSTEGEPSFNLEWTSPAAGRVVLFRTESAPKPGIGDAALTAAALAAGGLPESAELKYPAIAMTATTTGMQRVPVPREWSRAYFTPVTVLGDVVHVGTTVSATKPIPAARNVRLIERCFTQILTFAWPDGAASVLVFIGLPQLEVEQVIAQQPTAEVYRAAYERNGGLQLPNRLPSGCVVHVVPVAYAGGQRIMGTPSSVTYPGLVRIWYNLAFNGDQDNPATMVAVSVAPEVDNPNSPPFVLVHNPHRLPLSFDDGVPLTVRGPGDTGPGGKLLHPRRLAAADKDVAWTASVAGLSGYLRLFIQVNPQHARTVALIDPSIDLLRLAPPAVHG